MGEIKFPVTINGIQQYQAKYNRPNFTGNEVGELVQIRPCADEYLNKTYLGIYLGDFPLNVCAFLEKDTGILKLLPHSNPAIFVPDLKKIIFGCESWWGTIDSPEQLRQITDEDIQNVWYVKALKELGKMRGEEKSENDNDD